MLEHSFFSIVSGGKRWGNMLHVTQTLAQSETDRRGREAQDLQRLCFSTVRFEEHQKSGETIVVQLKR